MVIEKKTTPLQWGKLDLAIFGIEKNWQGSPLDIPAGFGMAVDDEHFWFVAMRNKPALTHPDSYAGKFTPELWKYDVAEFFMYDPMSGRYLEFNLAPNAAWWCAEFIAPRQRAYEEDIEMIGVRAYSDQSPDGSWLSAVSIPIDTLKARINFCRSSQMNVTFIIDSPSQEFLTANPPEGETPDFHQLSLFKPIQILENGVTFNNQQSPTV